MRFAGKKYLRVLDENNHRHTTILPQSYCPLQPLLLFGWMAVNLLQAVFTGLANDEAYYWMYSKNLDYGYFDHPPAIAWMIKAGYAVFHSQLGVRLLVVLLGTGFVWLAFQLTNRRSFPLFFVMLCSVSSFEAYSFIAVPDAPLIFFTASFFLLYKRWVKEDSFIHTLLLGLNIAALLYCKYHGLLILFFTLLSNLSLLKRRSFYLLSVLSVAAYLPHIIWQVSNDYPSYQYHVLTKSQDPYKPMDSIAFILGQLLIAGPLVGILLFFTAFRYRTQDAMEKGLKFTLTGFMVFFLISTLNAPVEANWTAAAFVPLLVLSYNYLASHESIRKWMTSLSLASCLLFLFMRINLAFDLVPAAGSKLLPEFYGWEAWALQIREKAKDTPVVFANSYQKASKYSFYSGQTGMSLNNVRYRRNQYDLWDMEDSLQGKRVMYVPNWKVGGQSARSFATAKGEVEYVFIDNFRSYAKIAVTIPQARFQLKANEWAQLPVTLTNQYGKPVTFGRNAAYPDWLVFCLFHEEEPLREERKLSLNGLKIDSNFRTQLQLRAPEKPGVYYLRISIQSGWLPAGINSRLVRMVVE